MLRLPVAVHAQMVAHCLAGLPQEACGLLSGELGGDGVERCYPARNAAASAKLYTVDPKDFLRADRDAQSHGLEIIGVFHSHTHTDAYPSATDIAQAPDPSWHYVIVSLRQAVPSVRSYLIVDGVVTEEPVVGAAEAGTQDRESPARAGGGNPAGAGR
jgi:[CysO sulfur-carrier protein]-S-L-cysteine hydrolase